MNSEFEQMLRTMKPEKMRMVSVANAIDVHVLHSLSTAHKMGFVNAILCGDTATIKSVANDNDIDISNFEIVHCDDELSAAAMAVSLVRNGRADIVMKGLIHTADILRAVLNRENGIRGDGILSHVSVLYSPSLNRRLFLTDIAMVMYPDLEKKIQLINNAVNFAHHMGVKNPRVAPLCAVETLNPAMQATVDAANLYDMNQRGEISGCIVGGPTSFDIAVSPDAACAKNASGPIQGDADILLFDNIEAGNNTLKAMVQFGDWIFGGVVIGARAPVIINSRSDSDISKLFSICCACSM
jgi:phosphate butyryltransferase